MEHKTFAPGERIFKEGDDAECAYLIESGRVELSKRKDNDSVVIGFVEKGELLGEMSLIAPSPRSATARCSEETSVMIIPKDDFQQRLEVADPVIRRMLVLMIKRLRTQTQIAMDKSTIIR